MLHRVRIIELVLEKGAKAMKVSNNGRNLDESSVYLRAEASEDQTGGHNKCAGQCDLFKVFHSDNKWVDKDSSTPS